MEQDHKWTQFLKWNDKVEFVWIQCMTLTSNMLVRVLPRAKFTALLQNEELLAMPTCPFHNVPGGALVEGAKPVGKHFLRPDLNSLYCQAGSNGTRAVVNADCIHQDGLAIEECPRSKLSDLHSLLQKELGFSLLIGYEVEVMFLRPVQENGVITGYERFNTQHAFTSMTREDRQHMHIMEAVARAIASVNIELEQFHAEEGPGQWEFVLPPAEPLQAINTLLRARETIMQVAETFGLRATVYTRPFPEEVANGSHVHISVNPVGKSLKQRPSPEEIQKAESFFAGVMRHFRAIVAFALPCDISYSRIETGIWSGGEYTAWGWENKEVPLRRVAGNRFEIKLVDGLSNPYLVMSAVIAAGIIGMRAQLPLTGGPCYNAPALMSQEERQAIGATDQLPKTLDAGLEALEQDTSMNDLLGKIAVYYIEVKQGEVKYLRKLDENGQRNYYIARH